MPGAAGGAVVLLWGRGTGSYWYTVCRGRQAYQAPGSSGLHTEVVQQAGALAFTERAATAHHCWFYFHLHTAA